jgi:hypothetical protein
MSSNTYIIEKKLRKQLKKEQFEARHCRLTPIDYTDLYTIASYNLRAESLKNQKQSVTIKADTDDVEFDL